MKKKPYVPAIALLLALGAGLALFFALNRDKTPEPIAQGNTAPDKRPPPDRPKPDRRPTPPAPTAPDPVVNERPGSPLKLAAKLPRILVTGRVVDASGAAIADAQVSFHAEGKLRALRGTAWTDAMGSYSLLAWTPQEGSSAAAESYVRLAAVTPDGGQGVSTQITVAAEEAITAPDIVVPDALVLEGRVVTEAGVAAPGARVIARSSGTQTWVDTSTRSPSVVTRQVVRTAFADEFGNFRFGGLPSATYRFTVDAGYHGMNTGTDMLDAGGNRGSWIELKVRAENWIRGIVRNTTGQPMQGVTVALVRTSTPVPGAAPPGANTLELETVRSSLDERGSRLNRPNADLSRAGAGRRSVTDAEGRFAFFQQWEAEYALEAHFGAEPVRLEGVKIKGDDYVIVVDAPALVGGSVRDAESGRQITNFDSRVLPGGGDVSDADPFVRVNAEREFPLYPQGNFVIGAAPATPFRVRISAPGFAPATLLVDDASRASDLQFRLKPLCDVKVIVTSEGRRLDLEPLMLLADERLAFEGASNELGVARLPGVVPGNYRVQVVLGDGTRLVGDLEVPVKSAAEVTVNLQPAP